jgi:hypothetical protein
MSRIYRGIAVFLFLFLPSVVVSITVTCLTQYNGYIASPNASDLCVECELRGFPNVTTGNCIYTIPATSNLSLTTGVTPPITTTCPTTTETVNCMVRFPPTNVFECAPSTFGKLCMECNERGQLLWASDYSQLICSCYSSLLDPSTGCQFTPLATLPYTVVSNVTLSYEKISCVSFQSTTYGCFAPVDSSHHRYGDPNPPVPTQCCSDIFGPPPGYLTESLLLLNAEVTQFQECNEIGTPDPNDIGQETIDTNFTTGFQTCSNHGTWNATTRLCTCDQGWSLGVVGIDVLNNNTAAYSCVLCDGPFWGPDVTDLSNTPPFCSKVVSPDPLTGELEECGGRGQYISTGCSCFSNSTIGYWTVANLTTTPNGFLIQSCAVCQKGYTFPSCL